MSKRSRAAPKTAAWQARQFRVSREGQSLRSMTVASLRKAILSLHFKPGEKLTERELCELTGVSRPLMREALRDLEAQGLISNVPHRGPAVAMLTREQGFSDIVADNWYGLLAPAGTPEPVITVLNKAVVAALSEPSLKEDYVRAGALPVPQSPAEFRSYIAAEEARWGEVIKRAKVQPE